MNEASILEKYNNKKSQLLKLLKRMEDQEIVPVNFKGKAYTKNTIAQLISNFEKEEFTISVCGQINAGKSTFLNHLLFKDKEVLPADDTPWTAKLSTIRYGKKDEADVYFYSKKEWQIIKEQEVTEEESGEATTYFEKYLKRDIDNSALEGIHEQELIEENGIIKKNIPLEDLQEYVAKGGKYTPFVKEADIFVNNEITKGVVFVDTPGINDQNTLRSRVTEDWINQSSAVIYLFYTGQAMGSADYEFIDTHLSSTPSSKILFLLTKADTSTDYEGAQRYVEYSLREDKELKARRFLTEEKKVHPISTMCSLLSYKKKNNLQLNSDEIYHLDRIEEDCSELLEKEGYFPDFIEAIQEHLMKDKGNAILDKMKFTINDIYRTKIESYESEKALLSQKLDSISLSATDLSHKKLEMEEITKDVLNLEEDYRIKIKKLQTEISNDLYQKLGELKDDTKKQTLQDCEEHSQENKSLVHYRIIARSLAKENIERSLRKVNSLVKSTQIEREVKDFEDQFSKDVKALLNKDLRLHLNYTIYQTFSIEDALIELRLNELTPEKLLESFGRYYFFNFKSKKDNIKSKINDQIKMQIENYFKNYVTSPMSSSIRNQLDDFVRETSQNLRSEVKEIGKNIIELEKSTLSKEEQLSKTKNQLKVAVKNQMQTEEKFESARRLLN